MAETNTTYTSAYTGEQIDSAIVNVSNIINGTQSVGAVGATQLTNEDIHSLVGAEHWGKTYFATSGNSVLNKPAGVDGFNLEILRADVSTTVHRLTATADASGENISPNIYIEQYITSWTNWEELVMGDGNYPSMTVGNATKLNGKAASDIFESDGVTAKKATNAQKLNGKAASEYALADDLTAHETNTNNPHAVTKSQVGLGNVANERQYSASNPPSYPVTSVSGKTGAVTLAKNDVGLGNVDNIKQYSSQNPPPYPVTSVSGLTGAISTSELASELSNYNPPSLAASGRYVNVDFANASQSSGTLTLYGDGLRQMFNITVFNQTENWVFGGSFVDVFLVMTALNNSKIIVSTDVDWVVFTYEASGTTARLRLTDAYGKTRSHSYHAWIGYI